MSGRSKLISLGKEFPRLTEKERDVLIMVHPYLDALSHAEAAVELCIGKTAVECRLRNIYKKIPWLQEDMRRKRTEEAAKRRSIRNPIRLGNMSGMGNDGTHDTLFGEKIIGKF